MPKTEDQHMYEAAVRVRPMTMARDFGVFGMAGPGFDVHPVFERRLTYEPFMGRALQQYEAFDFPSRDEIDVLRAQAATSPNRKERQIKRAIANRGKRKHDKGGRKK